MKKTQHKLVKELYKIYDSKTETEKSAKILLGLKNFLKNERDKIKYSFQAGQLKGITTVRANSLIVDNLIQVISEFAISRICSKKPESPFSIIAVGGYGRRELSPFSDIDILFLLPDNYTKTHEAFAEYILYTLWDLGFKVGQSFRTINDCIKQAEKDMVIRTNLLENRLIFGDEKLFIKFKEEYQSQIVDKRVFEFVKAKLEERQERLLRMGPARYLLEPDVKEGRGGLRDLHVIFWLAKYMFGITDIKALVKLKVMSKSSVSLFIKAHEFFSSVRCHLHYLAGRAENHLTFDMQQKIAEMMGFKDNKNSSAVERFMKNYYLHTKVVGDLTRIICSVLEEKNQAVSRKNQKNILLKDKIFNGFVIRHNRIDFADETSLEDNPLKLIEIFYLALKHDFNIKPSALQLITEKLPLVIKTQKNYDANKLFIDILCSDKNPEGILRNMSEVGVLSRFIPDFARVTAQMQYDMYHIYTTDEHTLRAVGILHDLVNYTDPDKKDELKAVKEIATKVHLKKPLFIAMFLHDIAKGRGGDHSTLGETLVYKIAPRFDLDDNETENIAWLVKNHLLMSQTAFRRDVFDNKTTYDFVNTVKSPERLRQLFALTCADIMAVGPNVWTSWKARLLIELYIRAEEAMQGTKGLSVKDDRVAAVKDQLAEKLKNKWQGDEISNYLLVGYPSYWLSCDIETLERHAKIVKQAEQEKIPIAVEFYNNNSKNLTDVIVYTKDGKGLFAKIAGSLSISGMSIVAAQIVTLANGMALDTFSIQDIFSSNDINEDKKLKIRNTIISVLSSEIKIEDELNKKINTFSSRTRSIKKDCHIIIDNDASKTATVLEINADDYPGFLYHATKTLTALDLQIFSAHIFTYGTRVVDVFYVRDKFGMKIEHSAKIKQIREAFRAFLN